MKNNSYPAFFTFSMFQDALSAARSDDDLIRLVCWPIANIAAPRSRWRAAGYSETLRDDAVIFAVEALWLHMRQRKDHISPTQATLYRLIRIAKNSVAMVLRKEEKHSRHCIISASTPSCDDSEDPFIYAVDAVMANRYQNQEDRQIDRLCAVEEIENALLDPSPSSLRHLLGTLVFLGKILSRINSNYVPTDELLQSLENEQLEPLATEAGVSRTAIGIFYKNVRALIGSGITRTQLTRLAYERTRRRKKPTSLSL